MKSIVKIENQIFEVEIVDLTARPVKAIVDGIVFEIWPEEMGIRTGAAADGKEKEAAPAKLPSTKVTPPASLSARVLAPIPGVINAISVAIGDEVKPGQQLCMLEAMKMNNAIRATREGVVAKINVSVGQHVKHGDVLIEYAE